MPEIGTFKDNESPLAAASPMRMPVKFPGPIPTTIKSIRVFLIFAFLSASSITSNRSSACPFFISFTDVKTVPLRKIAAAQWVVDVSIASKQLAL